MIESTIELLYLSMKLYQIQAEDLNLADQFVQKSQFGGLMQMSFWGDFKSRLGAQVFRLGVMDEDTLVGYAQLFKYSLSDEASFFYLPEGPVLDYENPNAQEIFELFLVGIDEFVDFGPKKFSSHLRFQPKLKVVPDYFSLFKQSPLNPEPVHTLMVDLNPSEKELLASMKPKCRYNIRLAERHGVEVKIDNSKTAAEIFYDLHAQTFQRNNETPLPQNYFDELFRTIEEKKVGDIFVAQYQGQVLATAFVLYYGKTAVYFHGGSSSEHKEVMASYALHWSIMKNAKERGYQYYDFRGLTDDTQHSWAGFSNFKRKFGGREVKYINAYDLVYEENLYSRYC